MSTSEPIRVPAETLQRFTAALLAADGVAAGEEEPFLLDVAMAVLACGNVFVVKSRGEREARRMRENLRAGIARGAELVAALRAEAEKTGVAAPF